MEACHLGAPGAESQRLIDRCIFSLHVFLAHSAPFALCPLWIVFLPASCLAVMSFVSLRPNSQCWPRSRTPSLWASPESWGLPVQIAVLLLQPQARLWFLQLRQFPQCLLQRPRPVVRWRPLCCAPRHSGASSHRTRTRSRSPAPLPKRAPRAPRRSSSVASGLRGSVALAESGLVTGLATKSCPPVPPPQLRLSRVARALHAASTESQPPAVASGSSVPTAPAPEAPRATEPSSNSDDEWDALLDAHGLTGTAAAVAQPAVAGGASRRARDKRRRRQRKASKRSMWRDI